MRSRHDTSQRVDEKGQLEPLIFNDGDYEVCKLLSPFRFTREPWSYQYLPSTYIAKLLGRGDRAFIKRLQRLKDEPHCYLALPEQPHFNQRPMVYSVGKGGIEELRSGGIPIRDTRLRRVPHELMASIIAASFEYSAMTVPGVQITVADTTADGDPIPDWPTFTLTTPYYEKNIFIEADTGSEQLDKHPQNNSIEEKLENYLALEDIEDTFVVFATVRESRARAMMEKLKAVVDKQNYPRRLARSFGFTHIKYDRFMSQIPPLTTWAVTGSYLQPAGPFSLMEDTNARRPDQPGEGAHSEA
jgi:hypothetical protein